MIYLTGDIHGEMEIKRLNSKNFPATKDDILIILGDFGLVWNGSMEEKYWQFWLEQKPYKTLVVMGNHECYDRIEKLPKIEMYGSTVYQLNSKVFILITGNVYNIDNKSFLVFGGATSIDKETRTEFISWWKQEVPSWLQEANAHDNIAANNGKIDYILAHTCPTEVSDEYLKKYSQQIFKQNDPVGKMLSRIVEKTEFKHFYYGHWHDEWNYKNYHCVYQNIVKLEE